MKRIWDFISTPQNLAALTAIAGLLAFLWNHLGTHPPAKEGAPTTGTSHSASATNQASARDNSISIQGTSAGRDVTATIGKKESGEER